MNTAMHKPTRFEVMRRNRPKLLKARDPKKAIRERINAVEREVMEHWTPTDVDDIQRVEDRLALQAELQLRTRYVAPSRLRRLLAWLPYAYHRVTLERTR